MYAIAVFNNESVKGIVKFSQKSQFESTRIEFDLTTSEPDKTHAIHIHEYGDLRDTETCCGACGGHWNPHHTSHGSILYPCRERHAGDLINNFQTDSTGHFHFVYYDPLVQLHGLDNIYGLSVVIHEGRDDLGLGCNPESLINGNAGKRIACSVIGKTRAF